MNMVQIAKTPRPPYRIMLFEFYKIGKHGKKIASKRVIE